MIQVHAALEIIAATMATLSPCSQSAVTLLIMEGNGATLGRGAPLILQLLLELLALSGFRFPSLFSLLDSPPFFCHAPLINVQRASNNDKANNATAPPPIVPATPPIF
jgi:hypothetical protein